MSRPPLAVINVADVVGCYQFCLTTGGTVRLFIRVGMVSVPPHSDNVQRSIFDRTHSVALRQQQAPWLQLTIFSGQLQTHETQATWKNTGRASTQVCLAVFFRYRHFLPLSPFHHRRSQFCALTMMRLYEAPQASWFGFCPCCFCVGELDQHCHECDCGEGVASVNGIPNQNQPKRFVTIRLAIGKQTIGFPSPDDLAKAVGRKEQADAVQGPIFFSFHPTTAYWRDFLLRTTPTFREGLCLSWALHPKMLQVSNNIRTDGLIGPPPSQQDYLYTRNPPNFLAAKARSTRINKKTQVRLLRGLDTLSRLTDSVLYGNVFGMCGCGAVGFLDDACPNHKYDRPFRTFILTLGGHHPHDLYNANLGLIDPWVLSELTGAPMHLSKRSRSQYPVLAGMPHPKIEWWDFISLLPKHARNKLIVFVVLRTAELNKVFGTDDILKFDVSYGIERWYYTSNPPPFSVQ